jgi:D-glycero-D-manno-heptose 1,7-bisphosphate phosphatase
VSNQSGVARGLLSEKDVDAVNKRMTDLLRAEGAQIDAIYYCPHLPEGKVPNYSKVCDCRKPRPGMLLRAAEEHGIDLAHSVIVGDAPRDVEAGLAADTGAVLLTRSATRAEQVPDTCQQATDLFAAVTDILRNPTKFVAAVKAVETQTPESEPEPEPTEETGTPKAKAPAKKKRRRKKAKKSPEETSEVASQEESEMAQEHDPIPVRKAPKEFTPEPDEEVEEVEATESTEKEVEPEESPAVMTHECSRCGQPIQPSDVEEGRAYDRDGLRLCATCLVTLQSQRAGSREVSNEELLRELRNITRALTYQRFSYWHILGAIAQAAAIFTCIYGLFFDTLQLTVTYRMVTYMMPAVFFQVLALTCFTLGRD